MADFTSCYFRISASRLRGHGKERVQGTVELGPTFELPAISLTHFSDPQLFIPEQRSSLSLFLTKKQDCQA